MYRGFQFSSPCPPPVHWQRGKVVIEDSLRAQFLLANAAAASDNTCREPHYNRVPIQSSGLASHTSAHGASVGQLGKSWTGARR